MFKSLPIVKTLTQTALARSQRPPWGEGMPLWQGASLVLGCLLLLSACGQKGPLQMPTDPKAAQRAGLIESLLPASSGTSPSPASAPNNSQPDGKTPSPSPSTP